ncbi:hypothetical protein ACWF62_19930 [Rhodococcus sp. NPDC054953]
MAMELGSRVALVAVAGLAVGTILAPTAAAEEQAAAVTFAVVENGDQLAVQVDGNKVTLTVDPADGQTCTAPTVLGGAIDVALLTEQVKTWDGTEATRPAVFANATVAVQSDGSLVTDHPSGIPPVGIHPAPYSVDVEGLAIGSYGAFSSCVDVEVSADASLVTTLVVRNFTVEQGPSAGGGDGNGSVGSTADMAGMFGSS